MASMREYMHLINDYLIPNPTIKNNGYYVLSEDKLIEILRSLNGFDGPDMYAVLGKDVYAIEHFEFDASQENRKGMQGIKEEALLKSKVEKTNTHDEWCFDKGSYSVSLSAYQKNFEKHFCLHYARIEQYKSNLRREGILKDNSNISIGFWIENKYPPYYERNCKYCGELFYFHTKQFCDLVKKASGLDFILFGCFYNGKPQIFYIDRYSLLSDDLQIDLLDNCISLSRLNNNELTLFINELEMGSDSSN